MLKHEPQAVSEPLRDHSTANSRMLQIIARLLAKICSMLYNLLEVGICGSGSQGLLVLEKNFFFFIFGGTEAFTLAQELGA